MKIKDQTAPTRSMRTPAPIQRPCTQPSEFDRGFRAAMAMVTNSNDLQRLKEASGIVAVEWDDSTVPMVVPECPTQPVEYEPDTVVVEVPVFASGA